MNTRRSRSSHAGISEPALAHVKPSPQFPEAVPLPPHSSGSAHKREPYTPSTTVAARAMAALVAEPSQAPSPGCVLEFWMISGRVPRLELAQLLGLTPVQLELFLEGTYPLHDSFAGPLEQLTGVSEFVWKDLERHYRARLNLPASDPYPTESYGRTFATSTPDWHAVPR